MAKLLTDDEDKLVSDAGKLYKGFCELEVLHPADKSDVCFHIHAIQNIIISRPAMRDMVENGPHNQLA